MALLKKYKYNITGIKWCITHEYDSLGGKRPSSVTGIVEASDRNHAREIMYEVPLKLVEHF